MLGGMVCRRTEDGHSLLVGDLLLTVGFDNLSHKRNVGFDMHSMVLAVVDHLLNSITEVAVLKVGNVEVDCAAGSLLGDEEVNFLPTHPRDSSDDRTEGVLFPLLIHQRIEFHELLGGHLGHYGATVSHSSEGSYFKKLTHPLNTYSTA